MEGLDAASAVNLLLLRRSGESCNEPVAQYAWRKTARAVGGVTAAYLTPSELADVWSAIKSMRCYREGGAENKLWIDLLAAVAARNATEIVSRGTPLLGQAASLSRDDLTYLTAVMAAAYLRMQQMPEARRLLTAQWTQLDLSGELSLALREMLALSEAGNNTIFAQAPTERLSDPSGVKTP
jgi:hypothetical protein